MPQRHTRQKDVIYAALTELGNHPTADMVYEHIHSAHPSISRATVFRVLRQLTENGQIARVSMFDAADCFDHNTVPHCHARCVRCHKIFDIYCEKPPISSFIDRNLSEFEISDYSLLLEGLCADCKQNREA